jgi:hypothetical protein
LVAFGVVRFGLGDAEVILGAGEPVVVGTGDVGNGDGGRSAGVVAGPVAASGTSAARGNWVWASACRVIPTTVNPVPITTAVAPATNV